MEQSLDLLKPNARIVVISFHSLEDRIVKHFLKNIVLLFCLKNCLLQLCPKLL
ncbi:16S rRNA (cytosine(1402)-N(4))-methyltransferase [Areca yellow leaf disease phytoplasma]|uniref:16S rRNA (cytosine(1402)-N(4))-methyltransferase n=1 Tax=Areca yellow leaf disease phytoplasma TaxID=927614 RepID=UPI0035B51358